MFNFFKKCWLCILEKYYTFERNNYKAMQQVFHDEKNYKDSMYCGQIAEELAEKLRHLKRERKEA